MITASNDNTFNYNQAAELYVGRTGHRPRVTRYIRFPSAAEAVRYAVEELMPAALRSSIMETTGGRFSGEDILGLYEAPTYPLARGRPV